MAGEVFSGVPGVRGSWGEAYEWEVGGGEGEPLLLGGVYYDVLMERVSR